MTTKHTPGTLESSGTNIYIVGSTAREKLVALPPTPYSENVSYAKLFAAAPELLEALKRADAYFTRHLTSDNQGIADEVSQAIRKAEGR